MYKPAHGNVAQRSEIEFSEGWYEYSQALDLIERSDWPRALALLAEAETVFRTQDDQPGLWRALIGQALLHWRDDMVPLAIAREDLQVALVEPRAKRSAFLRHVGRSLGLSNIEVIESRIEDLSGRAFDVATTRAVGRFAEWLGGAEFLADSASVLSWATDTEDLASALGARFRLEGSLPIPGSEKRRIVSFRRAS